MIETAITLVIVSLALLAALRMAYRAIFRRDDPCRSCTGECGSCPQEKGRKQHLG